MSISAITRINRATIERFLAGTHSPRLADVDIIDSTVLPEIVCSGFPGGEPHDHASYKAFFTTFRGAFTNMEFITHALVADEQFVAARFTVRVDHTGTFAGIAPTGRRVSFDGMALYQMQDGKIAGTNLHIDQVALLAQIGALPALAA